SSLTVRGDLDIATAPAFAAAVEAALAAVPHSLVVDLAPTTFLDSSGARQLARAARSARTAGVPMHVVCPRTNGPVRLPIDLLDLRSVVPIVDSVAEIVVGGSERDTRP
ncbi:MAG: STAS domain-containing protein, partial [Actinomycetes bacterium]